MYQSINLFVNNCSHRFTSFTNGTKRTSRLRDQLVSTVTDTRFLETVKRKSCRKVFRSRKSNQNRSYESLVRIHVFAFRNVIKTLDSKETTRSSLKSIFHGKKVHSVRTSYIIRSYFVSRGRIEFKKNRYFTRSLGSIVLIILN